MKKMVGFIILGLFLSGCQSREHAIICWDNTSHQETYNIIVPGNVYAFVVKGHSVLAYRDENNKVRIILLAKNICTIN